MIVKVKELSLGMMIKPRDHRWYIPRFWNIPRTSDHIEYLSFSHGTDWQRRSSNYPYANQPMIYLGFQMDEWLFEDVRKHHRVLVRDRVYILSGYDVRHLEAVE